MPHVTVAPVRVKLSDDELKTDRLRGVGYTWKCTCGDHGGRFASYGQARGEARAHERGHRTTVTRE